MRKFMLLPALIIVTGATLSSCANFVESKNMGSGCSGYVTSGPAVEEIRALEEDGAASNVKGQTLAKGQRMFAPGYVSVSPDGSVASQEDILRNYVDGKSKPWTSRFDVKELNIKVYCDMAIVVGLAEAYRIGAQEGAKPTHFRWLNIWTHLKGEWRLSATQFARF
jgi:hypothetical protein